MTGHVSLLSDYVTTIQQGDTYLWAGAVFYLQTWDVDSSTPFATVTLNYKGLIHGTPKIEVDTTVELSTGSVSKDYSTENDGKGRIYRIEPLWKFSYEEPNGVETDTIVSTRNVYTTGAVMQFTYRALTSHYRYISLGPPSGPSFGVVQGFFDPQVENQRIVTSDGSVYGPDRAVFFDLSLNFTAKVISFSSRPVFGSPYFECEEVVTMRPNVEA
jgi:hypothetical protein